MAGDPQGERRQAFAALRTAVAFLALDACWAGSAISDVGQRLEAGGLRLWWTVGGAVLYAGVAVLLVRVIRRELTRLETIPDSPAHRAPPPGPHDAAA